MFEKEIRIRVCSDEQDMNVVNPSLIVSNCSVILPSKKLLSTIQIFVLVISERTYAKLNPCLDFNYGNYKHARKTVSFFALNGSSKTYLRVKWNS